MSVKKYIKRVVRYIFTGIPEQKVYPQVSVLAPNQYLQGRSALITGGTSGIGFEIAKAFINAGAEVVITGRSKERLEEKCGDLVKETGKENVHFVEMDNANVSMLSTAFEEALSLMSQKKIDILVNNAGINGGHISCATERDFDAIIDTNLKGVFFLCQTTAKYMIKNHIEGNILNIASAASIRPAISAYQLSKWGVRGLTQGLARSLAPYGIVVNGIAPGPTATPMLKKDCKDNLAHERNLLRRYALPEEIASMAVFLTSSMGRTIIGDIVFMSGGGGIITNEDVDYTF